MAVTDDQLGLVVQLYHAPPAGIERRENGFFYAHCGCGYVSARRRTAQLAAEALIHHMRVIGRELIANGVSIPSRADVDALRSAH